MEKIPFDTRPSSPIEESVIKQSTQRKKLTNGLISNAGVFVSVFIVFAVIAFVTTDVKIASAADFASLGLEFFLFLFASYFTYVSFVNSGAKSGLKSKVYTDAVEAYDKIKKAIVDNGYQPYLYDFCRDYIDTELRNTKTNLLITSGFTYEEYVNEWSTKSRADIEASTLSESQKASLIKANAVHPIKLTPDMILSKGRVSKGRGPLSMPPEVKKMINFTSKLVTSVLVTSAMVSVVLDVTADSAWVVFASFVLRLVPIVYNGLSGYFFGFENVVVDKVTYINDQADLLGQCVRYAEEHINGQTQDQRIDEEGI
jgi:hypothetical protein